MKNYLPFFAFCLAGMTAFGQQMPTAPKNGGETEQLLIYPNPAVSTVTIKTSNDLPEGTYFVQIYNLQGKLVDAVEVNRNSLTVNIDNLEDGVYILAIVDDNDYSRGSGRIVKRR